MSRERENRASAQETAQGPLTRMTAMAPPEAVAGAHIVSLFKTYGFGGLYAGNDVAGDDEGQHGDGQRGDVYRNDRPQVEADRHGIHIISIGVQTYQSPLLLGEDEGEGDDVAYQHSTHNNHQGEVHERMAHLLVGGSQGFKYADGLCALKNENEEAAYHGDARHADHQYENEGHVYIKEIEPCELSGIVFGHADGLCPAACMGCGDVGQQGLGGGDVVEGAEFHFDAAAGVGAFLSPWVECGYVGEGGEYGGAVEELHVGVVDAAYGKPSCVDVFLKEVGKHAVARFQFQGLRLRAGDEDFIAVRQVSLYEGGAYVGGVVVRADAFQLYGQKVIVCLEDAHLCGNQLCVRHVGACLYLTEELGRSVDGEVFRRTEGAHVHHFDVGGHACYFRAHFLLEAAHYALCNNHHGQPQSYAEGGHADGRS